MGKSIVRRRLGFRPVCTGFMLLAGLILTAGPAGAQRNPAPYPHIIAAANPMGAPRPFQAPLVPLGADTATGFREILREPVASATEPLFLGLLKFWRGVISPVNGDQSDLAPVHSLYAVQAIQRHGVLLGCLLTTERLIHEPDEIPLAPLLREGSREFSWDPLAHNTYWLWEWLR